MDNFGIVGACLTMCPEGEMDMREREGLLHPLEATQSNDCILADSNRRKSFGKSPSKLLRLYDLICVEKNKTKRKDCPFNRFNSRKLLDNKTSLNRMRADPKRVVKEYSRSAAGRSDIDPAHVRPAPVLRNTMLYLLRDVARLDSPHWTDIYDFVFDRIRAVRQDMTIQGIVGRDAIVILEQTVRFHAYASYRLRHCDISEFDPVINKHHLLECLKELLCLYQTTDGPHENQQEFESIYLCDNLGNGHALAHCLSLPDHIREHPLVLKCFRASVCVMLKNYQRALRLLHSLKCPSCLCVVSYHLDTLRTGYLQILSHGYSVKNCQFPSQKLSELLHLTSPFTDYGQANNKGGQDLHTDRNTRTLTTDLCTACHLVDWFSDSDSSLEYIAFSKTKFVWPNERRPCPSLAILDEILQSSPLSIILSCGWTDGVNDGGGGMIEGGRGGVIKVENGNVLRHCKERQKEEAVDELVDRSGGISAMDGASGEKKNGVTEVGSNIVNRGIKNGVDSCGVQDDGIRRCRGVREEGVSECVGRGRGRGRRDRKKKKRDEDREEVYDCNKGGGGGGGVREDGCSGIWEGEKEKERIGVGEEESVTECFKSIGRGKRGKGQEGRGVERCVDTPKGRGRGRGRWKDKEEETMMKRKDGSEIEKRKGEAEKDGEKEEGDDSFSWENWSESDFSKEMCSRIENL